MAAITAGSVVLGRENVADAQRTVAPYSVSISGGLDVILHEPVIRAPFKELCGTFFADEHPDRAFRSLRFWSLQPQAWSMSVMARSVTAV
jgi:hypothetical protein